MMLTIFTKKTKALGVMLMAVGAVYGQTSLNDSIAKVPIFRQGFHDRVNKQQEMIDLLDTKNDKFLNASKDPERDFLISRALFNGVNQIKNYIEITPALPKDQDKKRALVSLESLLKNYISYYKKQTFNVFYTPLLVDNYRLALDKVIHDQPIDSIIQVSPYDVANLIYNSISNDYPVAKSAKNVLILKYCKLNPDRTFFTLRNNPEVPFADSLIRIVGKKYPQQLYDYAQANNTLGYKIRNIVDDDFIKAVVKMSQSRSGQLYFPFLTNIVNGKLTIDDVDAATKDSVKYFRLLVNTQMDYVSRMIHEKDTALAFRELTKMLEKKAKDVFVNTINGLHNENDNVRFRCLQNLTAEELYYVAVLTNGLIYTSSYTNGVYPLMMKKANNRGDSLLARLNFDHYRRFISQAAAYNKLGNFLGSFPNKDDSHKLMQAFVNNLENSDGLEDGVDVADSYASITETLKPIADEMLVNVKMNYDRNVSANNKRGMAIYNILYQLFLSADSTKKVDLTKELGIPPVYTMPNSSLVNDKGEVIMQVFFYGDQDGKNIFNGFQNMFAPANWTIDRSNSQWITIKSTKGKPVIIYANRPLPEETGEDDKAQQALNEYLETNNIRTTVTIHRGHSYYAESTIAYMAPSSRIVFMGSCGGFNLINKILDKSPDAHIIASKQIGKTMINKPFFDLLTEDVRAGKSIDWLEFWKRFEARAKIDGFEDYIPPYKNLGAIFIKAYKISMGEEDGDESRAF